MGNVKKYIDSDVLTEAKKRIKKCINIYDKVYVCFSGGKDSLVTLHLVKECYRELGIREKVNVIFRDEEVIPNSVIDFVRSYAESGEYNFNYYAVPLKSHKYILGKTFDYVQWDANRPHVREAPPYAIRLEKGDERVFDQYSMDEYCARNDKGKVAFFVGMRADESFMRLVGCLARINDNYISVNGKGKVQLVKPIYDWSEKDIFKYLYERGIKYCCVYDDEIFNGEGLRVATPLHAEAAKRLDMLRTRDPEYYNRVVKVFPEMIVQARYYSQFDGKGVIGSYPHTIDGLLGYIRDEITDPHQSALAKTRVLRAWRIRQGKMADGEGLDNFGGYPLAYLFQTVVSGAYKRAIPALVPSEMKQQYYDFEEGMRQ